jgi:2-dehydropantoate 2-reductase
MLQDVEAGRPLEVDAIVRSVSELARVLGVPVPFIEAILGLIALRQR